MSCVAAVRDTHPEDLGAPLLVLPYDEVVGLCEGVASHVDAGDGFACQHTQAQWSQATQTSGFKL